MSRRDRKRGNPSAARSARFRIEPGHNGLGGRLTPFFHATADPCVDAPRKERADIAGDITKAAPG